MNLSRLKAPLAGALVVASGIAVLGCSKTLDQNSLQNSIKGQLPNAKSVSCPSGVNAKSGVTFTCTVTLNDGSTVQVGAVQTDDNGHFNFSQAGGGAAPSGGSTDTTGASSSSTDTTGASSSSTDTSGAGGSTSTP